MKKVLRTKLQYTCNKYEDFCNIDREYKMVYDRSYDLIVTASTEEECWSIMDSFEEYMRKKGVQDTFDSNLEPTLNEKNNLWVGIVEVYIDNDNVAEQKEIIKDAYKEWKENIKTSSADSVEEKKEESKTIEEVQEVVEEKEYNKMSIEFKPQNTAINIGNSYSAKVLISEVNTDEKILDYGCGSGRNIKYIIECLKENKPSVRVEGCDIVEQLEKEKESHNKLREKGCIIVESNLLEKNKYDKILNSHVLNVIESDEIKNIVIKDIYNKLKKGGKAYFEVRTKADVEGAKTKEKYGDGWKIKKGKYFTYQEVISKEKMEKMLVENGFKVVQHICNSSKHFVVVSK